MNTRPFIAASIATGTQLAFFAALVGVLSGWGAVQEQIGTYWYYILPLALGFGAQVGLFVSLRSAMRQGGSRGMLVASGTTSTAAMVSCCTHYLANIIPVLGASGVVAFAAQYQVQFFWVGLVFNTLGIIVVARRLRRIRAQSPTVLTTHSTTPMISSSSKQRDPVCNMQVDPDAAEYTHVLNGANWYFCSAGCKQQFIEHPEHFVKSSGETAQPEHARRFSLKREAQWALMLLAIAVITAITFRGFTRSGNAGATTPAVVASSASPHQAADDGSGGVFTAATHEQAEGTATKTVFSVSLNTHTVDLSAFDPVGQIQLVVAGTAIIPDSAVIDGEKGSHHQNYEVTFPAVRNTDAVLVIRGVAGVQERNLPFTL